MDSIYCSGTDVEMSRMFDQYLFKGPESFDLSLTIPDPNQENATSYMSSDQTFHTPSFGDEEFEIPPINLPPSSMANEMSNEGGDMPGQGYNAPVMSHANITEPVSVITLGGPALSSQPMMVGSSSNQVMGQQQHYQSHGLYLQTMPEGTTMLTSQPNQLSSQSFETQPTYTFSAHATGAGGTQLLLQQQAPQQPQSQQPMMGSSLLTTITPGTTMGTQQMGMPYMVQRTSSVNGSPPGSNQTSPGQETSEDSDDSAQHSQVGGNTSLIQLMGGIKRPSPEPADIKNPNLNKKPKVPKKKKKRDPNEPQKPVSAYALFFRDTQAAIKGQNPNASFGEVSKIVASMWDSLDADHKNVYKKRTEAAKKEYLKALAAYRASLVSKQTAPDHMDSLYGSGPSSYGSTGPTYTPQQQQQQPPSNVLSSSTVMMTTSLAQSMPPIQQHSQMQGPPPQAANLQSQSQPSPINQAMQHPSQQSVSTGSTYQQQSNYSQQPQGTISVGGGQQQQQQSLTSQQGAVATTQQQLNSRPNTCLRNGCQNPPVESPEWDSEYCSNECVVSHCRDVFTAWVASRQTSNSFASVK